METQGRRPQGRNVMGVGASYPSWCNPKPWNPVRGKGRKVHRVDLEGQWAYVQLAECYYPVLTNESSQNGLMAAKDS